jgi:hypothetical protein
MPHFHLNVFKDVDALDKEGIERPNLEVAKLEAIVGARDIVANLIRYGKPVHRNHCIDITDEPVISCIQCLLAISSTLDPSGVME